MRTLSDGCHYIESVEEFYNDFWPPGKKWEGIKTTKAPRARRDGGGRVEGLVSRGEGLSNRSGFGVQGLNPYDGKKGAKM